MIFKTTPSLAFIYQLFHKNNYEFLSSNFKEIVDKMDKSLTFEYQDAIECALNLDYHKWNFVKKFISILKDYLKVDYYTEIDPNFIIEIFKKEVIELQKGYITVLHAKHVGYLVYDIIYQIVTGSYEGYKQKCKRSQDHPNEEALSIYNRLFNSSSITDHSENIRSRLISCNITLLNNLFNSGESTLDYLYGIGSQYYPSEILKNMNLSKKSTIDIIKITNKISKLSTNNILVFYSIPFSKINTYVYASKAYGIKLSDFNIEQFYYMYLDQIPWMENFGYFSDSQVRIIDLCLTKYGYKDGIRVNQMIDVPQNDLDELLKQIENIFIHDLELIEKISNQIDLPDTKKKNPLKSIKGYKTTVFQKNNQSRFDLKTYLEEVSDILGNDYDEIPYLEKKMLKKTDDAIFYASKIIKGRFKDAEKIISKDVDKILDYTNKVIKDRWIEVEDLILSQGTYDQIKKYENKYFDGYWLKAQPIFLMMQLTIPEYNRFFLENKLFEYLSGNRWKEFENFLLTTTDFNNSYIRHLELGIKYTQKIIGKRWKNFENRIIEILNSYNSGKINSYIKNPNIIINAVFEYCNIIIKGRWTNVEKSLIDLDKNIRSSSSLYWNYDKNWLIYYAKNIIQGRWEDLEKYLLENIDSFPIIFDYIENFIGNRWKEFEEKILHKLNEFIKNPEFYDTDDIAIIILIIIRYSNMFIKRRWENADQLIKILFKKLSFSKFLETIDKKYQDEIITYFENEMKN
jgi:hypothetical protein